MTTARIERRQNLNWSGLSEDQKDAEWVKELALQHRLDEIEEAIKSKSDDGSIDFSQWLPIQLAREAL